MKRIIATLLIISAVIALLCGCDYSGENLGFTFSSTNQEPDFFEDVHYDGFQEVNKKLLSFESEHYDKVKLREGFDSLPDEDMQSCYNRIEDCVYYISEETTSGQYKTRKVVLENVSLSEAQLRVVISAFFADNPQVFWLDNNFEYASNEEKTVLQFTSFMSASDIDACSKKLSNRAKGIIDGLKQDMSEYERELYIHDKLIELCQYDEDVISIEDNFRAFTSLGALVDTYAVCEGYSKAFQYLLSFAGIESYCIIGSGEDELHMWNVVSIDDSWYYVDTTWNEDEDSGVCYDYFNLSEDQLSDSHSIHGDFTTLSDGEICGDDYTAPMSFNISEFSCIDSSLTYYLRDGVIIDGIGDGNKEKLIEGIVSAASSAQKKDFAVFLYIDEDYIEYDYTVENLFYGGEYLIFRAIDGANYRMYETVDRDSVSIRKIPSLSAVNVYLSLE